MPTERDMLIDGYRAAGSHFLAVHLVSVLATSRQLEQAGSSAAVRDNMIEQIQMMAGSKLDRLRLDIAKLILANVERDQEDGNLQEDHA